MRIAFRVDASKVFGLGHLMRCLTVADRLKSLGHECVFYSQDSELDLSVIEKRGHHRVSFNGGALPKTGPFDSVDFFKTYDFAADAAGFMAVFQAAGDAETLVIDHYGLDARWHREVRKAFPRVRFVLVDDLANRPLEGEIVIDQNENPSVHARYPSLISKGCRLMLGLDMSFFLLNETNLRFRGKNEKRAVESRRLFLSMGGTDSNGYCYPIIEALLEESENWEQVDVVLGGRHPRASDIRSLVSNAKKIVLHDYVSDLTPLVSEADLAIGAGGVMSWERAFLGIPSILYSISDNQIPTGESLAQKGAARYLGLMTEFRPEALLQEVRGLRRSPEMLTDMRRNALALWKTDPKTLQKRLIEAFLEGTDPKG